MRKREEFIFIPLKNARRKRYKNAVGGVVHAVIQIAVDSDLSAEQRRLRVQHTYSPGTSPLLDPARRRERLRKTAPAAARRRGGGSSGIPAGLRQAPQKEEEVLERGRATPWMWCRCPPSTPLFIG